MALGARGVGRRGREGGRAGAARARARLDALVVGLGVVVLGGALLCPGVLLAEAAGWLLARLGAKGGGAVAVVVRWARLTPRRNRSVSARNICCDFPSPKCLARLLFSSLLHSDICSLGSAGAHHRNTEREHAEDASASPRRRWQRQFDRPKSAIEAQLRHFASQNAVAGARNRAGRGRPRRVTASSCCDVFDCFCLAMDLLRHLVWI